MRNCLDLSTRVAVVIGATSGIGRVIAVGLAEHGADVVPSGRREAHVDAACRDIERAGRRTLRQTTNVKDRSSIERLRDYVLEQFGRVDVLVNAAGYTQKQPTATVCEEQWSDLIDTNLTGVLRGCQIFYEPLK